MTDQAVEGNRLSDISHAARGEAAGFPWYEILLRMASVERCMRSLKSPPRPPGRGPSSRRMTFVIEPMVNMGTYHRVAFDDGQWLSKIASISAF